ncbi:MAG: immunity 26/phosphotriesterase HocA family protein [Candidatus Dormibacteria bacterium]
MKYQEGDWFAVPLRDGAGFGVGVIARMAPDRDVLLGYFFGPRLPVIPDMNEVEGLRASQAVMVRRFGALSLARGEWPILGSSRNWERQNWPMPQFARHVEIDNRAWRVDYPDDDPNAIPRESPITVEGYKLLPRDGMLGAGAVEVLLTKALAQPAAH